MERKIEKKFSWHLWNQNNRIAWYTNRIYIPDVRKTQIWHHPIKNPNHFKKATKARKSSRFHLTIVNARKTSCTKPTIKISFPGIPSGKSSISYTCKFHHSGTDVPYSIFDRKFASTSRNCFSYKLPAKLWQNDFYLFASRWHRANI